MSTITITEVLKRVMILGDIHGKFDYITSLCKKHKPEIILQCGDFGYWPNFNCIPNLENHPPIYFCDGNHENHFSLSKIKEPTEIRPKITYMPRGSVLKLNNKFILFMGGAESIDKEIRTFGSTWFPEEGIRAADMMLLPDTKIDIVISHTCPIEFDLGIPMFLNDNLNSRKHLSLILKEYSPKFWFFGHWHNFVKGRFQDTVWIMLNRCEEDECFVWL